MSKTALQKREADDKFAALVYDPLWVDNVLMQISEGEELVQIAKKAEISYALIRHHIMQSPALCSKYLKAEELGRECRVSAVMSRLAAIADLDVGDAYDEDGQLLPIKQMPAHIRKAIVYIESDGTKAKVKFPDRLKAIELIGKHRANKAFEEDEVKTDFRPVAELTDKDLEAIVKSRQEESRTFDGEVDPA